MSAQGRVHSISPDMVHAHERSCAPGGGGGAQLSLSSKLPRSFQVTVALSKM